MARTDITPARLTVHGIPSRYHEIEIADFTGDDAVRDSVQTYIDNMEAHFKDGRGLYLFGPNGTGKTLLTVAIMKAVFRSGRVAHSYGWPGLLAAKTAGWKDPDLAADYNVNVFGSALLVIDDLGKEVAAGKDLSVTVLDDVLRKRWNRMLPTIVTSNAEQKAIRTVYGDSVASLMNGTMDAVFVDGQDHRSFR